MFRTCTWLAFAWIYLATPFAGAADNTWTAAANNVWATSPIGNNWSLAPNYWDNAAVHSAFFTSTGAGTVSLNNPIVLRGINFQSGAYTITLNTLTLTNGGSGSLAVGEIQVASGLTPIINSVIAGTVGLNKTGAGTLILTGANTYTGVTTVSAGTLQVGDYGISSINIPGNAIIASNAILRYRAHFAPTISNTFSGAGHLAFSGDNLGVTFNLTSTSNSYSGETRVEGVVLTLGASGVIPDASVLVLGNATSNGYLNMTGFNETIGGLSGFGAVSNLGGSGTNTLTINQAIATTFQGQIGYSGTNGNNLALVKTGVGNLTLTGDSNSYTGGTTILGGGAITAGVANALPSGTALTIGQLASSSNGRFNTGGFAQTLSGLTIYAQPTNATVVDVGTGTLTLNGNISLLNTTAGAGNQYGATIAAGAGGTLNLGGAVRNITLAGQNVVQQELVINAIISNGGINLTANPSVAFANAAGMLLNATAANTYAGGTTVNAGVLNIAATTTLGATTGALTLNTTGTVASTVILNSAQTIGSLQTGVLGSGVASVNLNGAGVTLTDNQSGNTAYGGVINGAGSFVKNGIGTLTLNSANTYGGDTTILGGGAITAGVANALPSGTALTIGQLASSSNGRFNTGGFAHTISSLTIYAQDSGSTVVDVGTGTLTLNGNISLFDTTLSPGNRFGGTIAAGAGGTLDLGGAVRNITLAGQASGATPGDLTINAIVANGGINFTGNPSTSNGTPTGMTLGASAANTYAGGTTVNAGVLNVAAATTLGATTGALTLNTTGTVASTVNLNSSQTVGSLQTGSLGTGLATVNLGGASVTLTVNQSIDTTYAGVISGTGALTKLGSGKLTLSGVNTYSGANTGIADGTLSVSNDNNLGAASVGISFTNHGILQITGTTFTSSARNVALGAGFDAGYIEVTNAAAVVNMSGAFTGTRLFKQGPGTLILSNSGNTYGQGTIISEGTLQIGAGGTSGDSGTGSVAIYGALVFNRSDSATYPGAGNGPGSLTQAGTGTLTLTNPFNFNFAWTGGTFVTAGTLKLGTASAIQIPNNGNVTVSSGATFDIGSPASGSNFATPAGTITLNGGTLRAEGSASLSSYLANSLVMTSGTLDFTATTSSQFMLYFKNAVTINASSMTAIWNGSLSAPGATAVANNTSGPLTIYVAAGSTASGIDLDSNVSLSTPNTGGSWIKAGPGVMRMTQQTYAPLALTVADGKLRIDDINVFNSLTNNDGPNTLTLDGGTLQYGGPTATSVANTLTMGVNGGKVEIMTAATTLTLANLIRSGGLTKSGPGTLILNNAGNNFTGLTVAQGTLSVAGPGVLGTTLQPVTVQALGTLLFTSSATTSRTFNLTTGTLKVSSGQTLTFNGATVGGGFLTGTFATMANSTNTFAGGNTTVASSFTTNGGDSFANYNLGGQFTVNSSVTTTFSVVTLTPSGRLTLGSGGATSAIVNVSDFVSSGLITINDGASTAQRNKIVNVGTSDLYFGGGSRTFIGVAGGNATTVGIELNGQNAIVAGGLFVNNGNVTDSSAAGTSTVIADYGALVKGGGQYDNPPITRNGGKFQAGNSPGVATMGRFVFGPSGVSNYVFAIDDATGTAGPTPDAAGHVSGWGLVKTASWQRVAGPTRGDFAWTADPVSKLTVGIDTLVNPTTVGTDVPGLMADFDPSRSYSWPAVLWTGTYSGPTDVAALDAATNFDTSGFANPIAGSFGWSFDPAGQALSLTYTPNAVPEPGTFALVGLAAAGLACWRRRSQPISCSNHAPA